MGKDGFLQTALILFFLQSLHLFFFSFKMYSCNSCRFTGQFTIAVSNLWTLSTKFKISKNFSTWRFYISKSFWEFKNKRQKWIKCCIVILYSISDHWGINTLGVPNSCCRPMLSNCPKKLPIIHLTQARMQKETPELSWLKADDFLGHPFFLWRCMPLEI